MLSHHYIKANDLQNRLARTHGGRRDWWKSSGAAVPTPLVFSHCIRERCNGHVELFSYCGESILANDEIQYHVLRCSQNLRNDLEGVNCPTHGPVLKGGAATLEYGASPVGFLLKSDPKHEKIKKNHISTRWFLETLDEVRTESGVGISGSPENPEGAKLLQYICSKPYEAFQFRLVELVWFVHGVKKQVGGSKEVREMALARWLDDLIEKRQGRIVHTLGIVPCVCTHGYDDVWYDYLRMETDGQVWEAADPFVERALAARPKIDGLCSLYETQPELLPESEAAYRRYCNEQKRSGSLSSHNRLEWFYMGVLAPTLYNKIEASLLLGTNDAATAGAAANRKAAFGLTSSQLDRLESDIKLECEVSEMHKRYVFEELRSFMLDNFTATDGAEEPTHLVEILRREHATAKPGPVPRWWSATQGFSIRSESKGYLACENIGCSRTETADGARFKLCSKCKLAAYCSRECQASDWTCRHKKCCKIVQKHLQEVESKYNLTS